MSGYRRAMLRRGGHGRSGAGPLYCGTWRNDVNLNAAVFLAEAIDPETSAFNDAFRKAMASTTPFHEQEPAALRESLEGGGPLGPETRDPDATDRFVAGPAGNVPIRVLLPDGQPRGVYLHIHGGGFMVGTPSQSYWPKMDK